MTLLKRGYTADQFKRLVKGMAEDEKRKLLAQGVVKIRERLGAPEARPFLRADYRIHEEAVMLTRPKKVRISSKTLREDVVRRLRHAGVVVKEPSPLPVKAKLDLHEAIRHGTQMALDKESVVRLDYLLGEIVRMAPGQVANETLAQTLRDDRRFLIRRLEHQELFTTRQVLNEEKTLLASVIRGMGPLEPLQKDYLAPAALVATSERIDELVSFRSSVNSS